MGVEIPDGAMDQAKPFMDMIDAMGQEMFNEIIDENGDGAASLEEIEMVRKKLRNFLTIESTILI